MYTHLIESTTFLMSTFIKRVAFFPVKPTSVVLDEYKVIIDASNLDEGLGMREKIVHGFMRGRGEGRE